MGPCRRNCQSSAMASLAIVQAGAEALQLTSERIELLIFAMLVIAFLYSSVGHAGASGYIAVMTLFGLAPAIVKPTALVLNILVATITSYQFWRAGHFSWRLFWPFAALSIPFAFGGGYINLPVQTFKIAVGVVLLVSAVRTDDLRSKHDRHDN